MQPEKNGNYWRHDEEDINLEPAEVEEPEQYDEPEPDDEEDNSSDASVTAEAIINWDAKEHLTHKRGSMWFVILIAVALALLALSIFILKSYTFAALIVVSVLALLIYVMRPPRSIHYSLSSQGLQIDNTLHDFDHYKAFGVLQDESEYSLVLIPKRQFSPATTVYFPESRGEEIVDIFGAYLPMQEVKLDAIDKIIRKLRI